MTRWLSVGATYSYSSGAPTAGSYRNEITGKYEDYRAHVGVDPGNNINDPADDRPLRLPDIQRLNIKVNATCGRSPDRTSRRTSTS